MVWSKQLTFARISKPKSWGMGEEKSRSVRITAEEREEK